MRSSTLLLTAAAVAVVTAALVALPAFADSKTYSLSGFDQVNVSAGTDVTFTQGPYAIRADEPNGNFDRLIIEMRGNTLRIARQQQLVRLGGASTTPSPSARPTSPPWTLRRARRSTASTFRFAISRSMSPPAPMSNLSGSCAGLRVDVSSGADFEGEALKCETASVDASSGAGADAFATRSASGNASSGGNVTFHGRPPEITKDTSSGGSVRAR